MGILPELAESLHRGVLPGVLGSGTKRRDVPRRGRHRGSGFIRKRPTARRGRYLRLRHTGLRIDARLSIDLRTTIGTIAVRLASREGGQRSCNNCCHYQCQTEFRDSVHNAPFHSCPVTGLASHTVRSRSTRSSGMAQNPEASPFILCQFSPHDLPIKRRPCHCIRSLMKSRSLCHNSLIITVL